MVILWPQGSFLPNIKIYGENFNIIFLIVFLILFLITSTTQFVISLYNYPKFALPLNYLKCDHS